MKILYNVGYDTIKDLKKLFSNIFKLHPKQLMAYIVKNKKISKKFKDSDVISHSNQQIKYITIYELNKSILT